MDPTTPTSVAIWPVFIQGLALSFGLIVAIGAQNAFVLRQGLRREHVGSVVLFCAAADAILIMAGVFGMAQALGETAPLLMIGMVAFIVDSPSGSLGPATALPVQIFIWADSPERAFVAKTSAAILVLLAFLILMNALAVYLRRRFERRW